MLQLLQLAGTLIMSIKLSVLRTLQLAVQPESSSSDKSFDIQVNTKSVICDMEGGGHNVSVQGVSVTLQHRSAVLQPPGPAAAARAVVVYNVYSRCPRADSNTALSAAISRVSVYLSICSLAITAPVSHPATLLCVELAACVHSVMWHELQLLSPWSRILFEMRN